MADSERLRTLGFGPVDRASAEKELNRLLNRALRSVPFVKLDKVEEVTGLFEQALDTLERNCALDPQELEQFRNDRKQINDEWNTHGAEGHVSQTSDSDDGEKPETKHGAFAMSKLRDSDSSGRRHRFEGTDQYSVAQPLPQRAASPSVTRDYSSPRGSTRVLGLGVKAPSSRASGSLVVQADEAEPDFLPRRANMDDEGQVFRRLGNGGEQPDDDEPVAVCSQRFTQDYSSPKGQRRQLAGGVAGGRQSSRATVAMARQPSVDKKRVDSDEDLESISDDELPARRPGSQRKRGHLSHKERESVKVPLGASPRQIKSSLLLLSLATPTPESRSLDQNSMRPSGEEAQGGFSSVSSSPLADTRFSPSGSPSDTPKPAFLRRLDSPQSHHGKLIAARARLTAMMNLALRVIPKINPEGFEAVKRDFAKAISQLESGVVSP